VAFIKQEALEKAREIRVKADEEFAIEKVPLFGSLNTYSLTS
jgi:V-type H+-transporting ATPase subunit E